MSDEDISFSSAVPIIPEARMSSLEIAELTGKLHKTVLADIGRMLAQLGLRPADFSARYRDEKGEVRTCCHLPKRETMILITGYSVPVRAAVVDRWSEMEAKAHTAPSIPPQTEQLLAPVLAPLAAISHTLQALVQMNAAHLQPSVRERRSGGMPTSSKPITEMRRATSRASTEGLNGESETSRLGRKPTFVREDVSAVLTLTKKGMSANNIAKALNLSASVVEHIRFDPAWADRVLKKWGL